MVLKHRAMEKMAAYLFYALYALYVVFELVTWLYYTPSTAFDAFAAVIVPALALWIIYWTNLKAGEGIIGLFRRVQAKTPDAPKDG